MDNAYHSDNCECEIEAANAHIMKLQDEIIELRRANLKIIDWINTAAEALRFYGNSANYDDDGALVISTMEVSAKGEVLNLRRDEPDRGIVARETLDRIEKERNDKRRYIVIAMKGKITINAFARWAKALAGILRICGKHSGLKSADRLFELGTDTFKMMLLIPEGVDETKIEEQVTCQR